MAVMSTPASATTAPAADLAVTAAPARRWRTEDWIAVVLGFLVITSVLLVFQWKVADLRNVVPTFRWTTDSQIASLTPGWTDALGCDRARCPGQGSAERGRAEQRSQGRARRHRIARRSKRPPASWPRSAARPRRGARDRNPRSCRRDGRARVHAGEPVQGPLCRHRLHRRRRDRRRPGGQPCAAVPDRAACGVRPRVARPPARRQRTVRRLGHRVRHLRARARPPHQQHGRRSGVAQARGADRILHQDRSRHPRRQPALARRCSRPARSASRRPCWSSSSSGTRASGWHASCASTTNSPPCCRPRCRSAASPPRSRRAARSRATRRSSPTSPRWC